MINEYSKRDNGRGKAINWPGSSITAPGSVESHKARGSIITLIMLVKALELSKAKVGYPAFAPIARIKALILNALNGRLWLESRGNDSGHSLLRPRGNHEGSIASSPINPRPALAPIPCLAFEYFRFIRSLILIFTPPQNFVVLLKVSNSC